ncbi:MAG TPA: dihydrolipoamide acetyltransferase family protein, partial [Anaerolineales bacterium]|nr:dihydrolipoamide acetyltransferase family protein [Anaerolineales bacterium]
FKKEGDSVKRGDVLFSVESDKAVLEVEATARGFLRKILVQKEQVVPVLTVVALITREAEEDITTYSESGSLPLVAKPTENEVKAEPAAASFDGVEEATRSASPQRIFVSPRARRAANEKGVDLTQVPGTGPGGRVVEQDVLSFIVSRPKVTPVAARAAEDLGVDLATVSGTGFNGRIMKEDVVAVTAQFPDPAPLGLAETPTAESVPVTGLRRIIAERMAASNTQTAPVTLVTEADATAFVAAREQLKATVSDEWGFAPGYNDLLGLIVSRALREFPYMNARLSADGTTIERLTYVNLGMAVDTERGLLVPVIRDADQKGLREFGTEFRALVELARVGKSLPDDLAGGTFTITNLGMFDIDAFTPIINLPEAAILGVGRIQSKAVFKDGELVELQMWTLSMTFDHRLVDGGPAARFLQRIKQLVENPYLLLG